MCVSKYSQWINVVLVDQITDRGWGHPPLARHLPPSFGPVLSSCIWITQPERRCLPSKDRHSGVPDAVSCAPPAGTIVFKDLFLLFYPFDAFILEHVQSTIGALYCWLFFNKVETIPIVQPHSMLEYVPVLLEMELFPFSTERLCIWLSVVRSMFQHLPHRLSWLCNILSIGYFLI